MSLQMDVRSPGTGVQVGKGGSHITARPAVPSRWTSRSFCDAVSRHDCHLSVLGSGQDSRAGEQRLYVRDICFVSFRRVGRRGPFPHFPNKTTAFIVPPWKHFSSLLARWLGHGHCVALEKVPATVGGGGSLRCKGSFVPCGRPKWEFGKGRNGQRAWLTGRTVRNNPKHKCKINTSEVSHSLTSSSCPCLGPGPALP